MKIRDLRLEAVEGRSRASARVEWEESGRPAKELFIEAGGASSPDLRASGEAFLLGCFPPAFRHRERRIFVEGAVCPRLRDGIVSAMQLLRFWYEPDRPLPALEASGGFYPPEIGESRSVGMFLSGGVDSLFSLRKNMLEIPASHPAAVRAGIQAFGHDCPDPDAGPWTSRNYANMRAGIRRAADDAGVEVVPMRFNLRALDPDPELYVDEWCGASVAAAAHALARRFGVVFHASSREFHGTIPYGDHPFFDLCYASSALSFVHDGMAFPRQQKLAVLAQWPAGLRNIRVCSASPIPEGFLNCGLCEKCIRTRIGLLLLGRLKDAVSFPPGEISAEQISRISHFHGFAHFWHQFPDELRRIGRDDLARASERKLDEYFRHRAWVEETGWKGAVKRLDRRALGGRLRRVVRALRPGA